MDGEEAKDQHRSSYKGAKHLSSDVSAYDTLDGSRANQLFLVHRLSTRKQTSKGQSPTAKAEQEQLPP
jgi:hypothetical protein